MNNQIVAPIIIILVVGLVSGIAVSIWMNQGNGNSTFSEELLQVSNSGIWYGGDFSSAQVAVLINNERNAPATIRQITIRGIKCEWENVYYWKGDLGSISTLGPVPTELTGTSFTTVIDGNERAFQQATNEIQLEGYKTIVLCIRNAGNIISQNMPSGNVTITVFTEKNVYLSDATVTTIAQTEQLAITNVEFSDSDQIVLSVRNSGTSNIIITSGVINSMTLNETLNVPVSANSLATITLNYKWTAGNNYQIKLVSAKGTYFPYTIVAPDSEFMQTEQLTITNAQFTGTNIILSVRNTGTNSITITSATVNGENVAVNTVITANTGGSITVPYAWVSGYSYQIRLLSAKGTLFPYNAVAP